MHISSGTEKCKRRTRQNVKKCAQPVHKMPECTGASESGCCISANENVHRFYTAVPAESSTFAVGSISLSELGGFLRIPDGNTSYIIQPAGGYGSCACPLEEAFLGGRGTERRSRYLVAVASGPFRGTGVGKRLDPVGTDRLPGNSRADGREGGTLADFRGDGRADLFLLLYSVSFSQGFDELPEEYRPDGRYAHADGGAGG